MKTETRKYIVDFKKVKKYLKTLPVRRIREMEITQAFLQKSPDISIKKYSVFQLSDPTVLSTESNYLSLVLRKNKTLVNIENDITGKEFADILPTCANSFKHNFPFVCKLLKRRYEFFMNSCALEVTLDKYMLKNSNLCVASIKFDVGTNINTHLPNWVETDITDCTEFNLLNLYLKPFNNHNSYIEDIKINGKVISNVK